MSYQTITAELKWCSRRGKTRVFPVQGQPFPTDMHIECSRAIRRHPIGTKIRICVKLKDTYHATPHLYSHYNWSYSII